MMGSTCTDESNTTPTPKIPKFSLSNNRNRESSGASMNSLVRLPRGFWRVWGESFRCVCDCVLVSW